MSNRFQYGETLKTWTIQIINFCLAYSLSVPVELDINAAMYLAKDYLGIFSLLTVFNRNSFFVTAPVSDQHLEKSFEELIA